MLKKNDADEAQVVLKARLFIKDVSQDDIPVSVDKYVSHLGASLKPQSDLGPDEPGFSILKKDKLIICVNGNDKVERQRFTACHEIAHHVLKVPSEHSVPRWSYEKSIGEIQCDVFAAELLLPFEKFRKFADRAAIGLGSIDEFGKQFQTSTMATGSRFAAVLGAPCAFVLSEKGEVKYTSRSRSLRDAYAWIPTRIAVPSSSVTARVRAGETVTAPEEIEAERWFCEWDRGGVLLEESRHFKSLDQSVTLLWFADGEVPRVHSRSDDANNSDDEEGLEELDGNLRWSSKDRR